MSKRNNKIDSAENRDKGEIEICKYCDELILDTSHDCQDRDENSYSDRLQRGFDMLNMED